MSRVRMGHLRACAPPPPPASLIWSNPMFRSRNEVPAPPPPVSILWVCRFPYWLVAHCVRADWTCLLVYPSGVSLAKWTHYTVTSDFQKRVGGWQRCRFSAQLVYNNHQPSLYLDGSWVRTGLTSTK